MKPALAFTLLVAALCSACTSELQDVDFCEVLANRAKFEGHEFKTELGLNPDSHGWVAQSPKCPESVFGLHSSSFEDTPELKKLGEQVEAVDKIPPTIGSWKVVWVQVTARVEENDAPPPDQLLRLLTARNAKVIDIPEYRPPGSEPPPADDGDEGQ